jgi:CHAD domain-containing protein
MKAQLEESTCVYGGDAIRKHIQSMRQEIEGVRQATDIECIHRMRVASRRLRTGLQIFSDCLPTHKSMIWRKKIRNMARALGAARDADVQIERLDKFISNLPAPKYRPGVRRLQLRIIQNRTRLQKKVASALDQLEKSQSLDQLEHAVTSYAEKVGQIYLYTPSLYHLAFTHINKNLQVLLSFDAIVYQPEKVEELHAMRIAAKHLRYTTESFAPLYPEELKSTLQALRKIQDALGDIHDSDVWSSMIPQFLKEEEERTLAYFGSASQMKRLTPGILYFQEEQQKFRQKRYDGFVQDWQHWKVDGFWEKLQETIRLPFFVTHESAPASPEVPENQESTPQSK